MDRCSLWPSRRIVGPLLALAVFLAVPCGWAAHPSDVGGKTCTDCHTGFVPPSEAIASTGHFYVQITCTDCHATGGTSNLHLVREVIWTWYTGDRDVSFTAYFNKNSYADGDTVLDGVCEVCHALTAYHRGDPTGDHTHYPGAQCTFCHLHDNFFAPVSAVGTPDQDPAARVARVFPVPSRGPVTIRIPGSPGPHRGLPEMTVFDIAGRRIRTLSPAEPEGEEIVWDGRTDIGAPAEPGVYFIRVCDGDRVYSAKAVLIR